MPVSRLLNLTNGGTSAVDDQDFDRCAALSWHSFKGSKGKPYVKRNEYLGGGRANAKSRNVLLHRFILGVTSSDAHVDGDGLNNQRCNLRLCTRSENMANRAVNTDSVSGLKGVRQDRSGRYVARIKQKHLGTFDTAGEAAAAYNEAARKLFGEFAKTNAATLENSGRARASMEDE